MMTGIPALRERDRRRRPHGAATACRPDAGQRDHRGTSGATEAIFNAIHAVVRRGRGSHRPGSLLRLLRTGDRIGRRRAPCIFRSIRRPSRPTGRSVRDAITPEDADADDQLARTTHPARCWAPKTWNIDRRASCATRAIVAVVGRGLRTHRLRRCAIHESALQLPGTARTRFRRSPASARPTTAPAGRSATASRRRR